MTEKQFKAGDVFPLRSQIVASETQQIVSELTLMRPKGRAIREMATAPEGLEQGLAMVRGITGLSALDLDEIDGEDLIELIEVAAGFFDRKASGTAMSDSGDQSSPTAPQS